MKKKTKKIFSILYYIFSLLIWIFLIGSFTITRFKPEIVDEYKRCYICNDFEKEEKYLCDCQEIQIKENVISWWYYLILVILALYVIIYGVKRLINIQKEKWKN